MNSQQKLGCASPHGQGLLGRLRSVQFVADPKSFCGKRVIPGIMWTSITPMMSVTSLLYNGTSADETYAIKKYIAME